MTHAGNFFPPDFKQFPFKEGDLLANQSSDGRYSINKILRVDKVFLRKGQSIIIQGKNFTLPEDDFLLIVSATYGETEFQSLEQARAAAKAGKWTVKFAHIPNRPAGAAAGQIFLGSQPVNDNELTAYRIWRKAFDKGEAGVF